MREHSALIDVAGTPSAVLASQGDCDYPDDRGKYVEDDSPNGCGFRLASCHLKLD